MAIRMPFPADTNPDPLARYRRTVAEAFPCDASQAKATQSFPARKHPGRWLALALLALITLAMAGCSGAEAQEASTIHSDLLRAAASAWICPGMHAEWLDDTTARCLKEKP